MVALASFSLKNPELIKSFKAEVTISRETTEQLARRILIDVMRFRRIAGSKKSCATTACQACLEPHMKSVIAAIEKREPITFVLPAFPGKSPNPAKVVGTLPDMAERLSLEFLAGLSRRIQTMYAPGARIVLCSDGRVFNDIIGIRNADLTDYQQEISRLIKGTAFSPISTFNLDDVYSGLDFDQMRHDLMEKYGDSLDELRESIRRGSKKPCSLEDEEAHRQYCGITRFLVEDAMRPGLTQSRTSLQKDCRQRSLIVIQRSRAWTNLIAEYFPHAVRLSIHPQTCGSAKLGIRLMEAESWMTPWHGVAVNVGGRFVLLKRAEAEGLGAQLIYRDGRPSHYECRDEQGVLYDA